MSLVISTGSNLGDRAHNLEMAKNYLSKHFKLKAASRVYWSKAVDFMDQPDFYNQVLEFITPNLAPEEVMDILLGIESKMGRVRKRLKGPRLIDLDILFIDNLSIRSEKLVLPHPRLFERAFVVLPLKELSVYKRLDKYFDFGMNKFCDEKDAIPLK